jgi:hypothetical protein
MINISNYKQFINKKCMYVTSTLFPIYFKLIGIDAYGYVVELKGHGHSYRASWIDLHNCFPSTKLTRLYYDSPHYD